MSRSTLVALLFGVLLVAAPFARADESYADDDEEDAPKAEDDVLVLTTKNFDATIAKHKYVLAEFYAPWCGHCKTLAPEYAKAAAALKSHDADVVLAKIDATVENDLASKYDVKGYPTIKWFVDGVMTEYQGPREADGIVGWIKKKTGPATVSVDSAEKVSEIESSAGVVVVGYFSATEGPAYEAFKKAGGQVEDVDFVETTSAAVAAVAGLTKPGVALIKAHKGEERVVLPYADDAEDSEALRAFVNKEKMPLTIEFSQATSDKIFNSGIKRQLILWATGEQLAADNAVFKAYAAVARAMKGELMFVTSDTSGPHAEPITNFFGLKDATAPVLLAFDMEGNKKFKLPDALTEESVLAFAKSVLDGTAPLELKSAPIPEDNKDEHVTVVVGKTVDSIVYADDKDVLLEVYAPWCGHCKQLDPIYKKLAKRFRKVDSVVIAKMDGTENEHPTLEVKGYPTIFFIPAGSSTPIPYEGDRTLKGFTKYIKDNAKIPYTLPKKGEDAKDEL